MFCFISYFLFSLPRLLRKRLEYHYLKKARRKWQAHLWTQKRFHPQMLLGSWILAQILMLKLIPFLLRLLPPRKLRYLHILFSFTKECIYIKHVNMSLDGIMRLVWIINTFSFLVLCIYLLDWLKEQAEAKQKKKEREKKECLEKLKSAIIISGIVVAVVGAAFAITKKLREKWSHIPQDPESIRRFIDILYAGSNARSLSFLYELVPIISVFGFSNKSPSPSILFVFIKW